MGEFLICRPDRNDGGISEVHHEHNVDEYQNQSAMQAILSRLYLERAAASVKPPRRSMIIGDHMAEQMNLDASTALKGSPESGSTRVLNTTIRNGSSREVVKRGMASVAQSSEAHTSTAKQFFCCSSCNGENISNVIVTIAINNALRPLAVKIGVGMLILRPAPR
ncbi:hypothetical protein OGATHE_002890 [Ogataea polymorpha]|uniref:Uncharacterized protein n=1 Tax=Ogataea polymorpha TaxID=460523 RepID=A0A9P8PF07_9ASCO|nr:hypothetical protein OGATHE_002890 [Ogataea polymorpha]